MPDGRVPHPASTVSSAIRAALSTPRRGSAPSRREFRQFRHRHRDGTGHGPGTPVRHGPRPGSRVPGRARRSGQVPRRLRHHLATVPSSTSRRRSAVPRCRGRITRGLITRGPAISQRFLPGRIRLARRSIQQDRVRVRALRASGRCACLGHHPLRPVPAVRGIAGDRSLRWRAIRHRAAGHRTLCSRRESVSDRAARLSAVRWRT